MTALEKKKKKKTQKYEYEKRLKERQHEMNCRKEKSQFDAKNGKKSNGIK